MTTKTAARKPAAKTSTKTAPAKVPAAQPAPAAKTVKPSTATAAVLQRAEQLLKKHGGNAERALDEAGAQGDAKTAAAIQRTAPASAAKLPAAKPVETKPAPAAAKPEAPAAPKANAAPKGETKAARSVIPADAKLTVLAKENPRRAGTLGARTFAIYKTGMTVGEWREAVAAADCDPGYLHADIRAGYISVK